jgi:hypothetical protein|nr:MAG TPA: hypothetical protein [Caudoviricetes sp.]
MKELVVVNQELKEVNTDSALEVVKFTFNDIEGRFAITSLASSNIFHIYWNGFATWSNGIEWWDTDTTFEKDRDNEFVEAFKEKFGIEIPIL